MKKLLILIIIITLPLIAFFQYKRYERFHPPVSYEYDINDSIDVNYHDHQFVKEYFANAVEISAYARQQWRNEGVDVRFPNQNSQTELTISKYYNDLVARTQWLEAKLVQSDRLKRKGYNNDDVKKIESGVSLKKMDWENDREQLVNLAIGSRGEHVWLLQRELDFKGYDHTLDGVFGVATEAGLAAFQQDNGLFPSGHMSERTFEALFLK